MFGVLLKKQIFEVFRSWFVNTKTNKARSSVSIVVTIVLFGVLMLGVIGGMFAFFAISICPAMISADVEWLYFDIFGLIALVLGLFGSVFNTFAGLYLAKDNDLLLSMPIPVPMIIASRILNVYLLGLMYSSIVFVPSVVVYQIVNGFDAAALIGGIIMTLEISLIVLVLSCILGWVVARISLKLKRRSYATVIAAIAFIGLYYFVYFKAQDMISDLVQNAAEYGEKIKGSAYFVYAWGKNATGKPAEIAVCLTICAVLAAITWIILSKSFIKIATATPNETHVAVSKSNQKVRCLSSSLLSKEFARFSSSANYMLNCGLGILFIPAAGVLLLLKGGYLIDALSSIGDLTAIVSVGVAFVACLLASMNDMAAPSVSLEGGSLWIIQSLPIDPWHVIRAKLLVQIILTAVPMAFLAVCAAIALSLSVAEIIAVVIFMAVVVALYSLFAMFIGLKMPNLHWTNEIVPIKQSGGVAIVMFGGWGYAVLVGGGYALMYILSVGISPVLYLICFSAVSAVASFVLYRWLKTKGADVLRHL